MYGEQCLARDYGEKVCLSSIDMERNCFLQNKYTYIHLHTSERKKSE